VDVKLLFSIFGRLRGVSVAVDARLAVEEASLLTLVHFLWKADAEKTMARVDGHAYGHFTLHVVSALVFLNGGKSFASFD
jgi:hypothetical protein